MGKLIVQKILLYIVVFTFVVLCVIPLKEEIPQANAEMERLEATFKQNVLTFLQEYNYLEKDANIYDLEYINENNNVVRYKYKVTTKGVKINEFNSEINLNFEESLNETYDFFNQLYIEDIKEYDEEIQKMIDAYKSTNETQEFQVRENAWELTLRIKQSENANKDYKLYYSVWDSR